MTIRVAKVRRDGERGARSAGTNFAVVVLGSVLALLIFCGALIRAADIKPPAPMQAQAGALQQFAADFWSWRAHYQPFSTDDIPRLEHPAGERDWSARSIAKQRAQLEEFEARWKKLDRTGWTPSEKSTIG